MPTLHHLVTRYPALEACRAEVDAAFTLLRDAFASKGRLLICGNGGSAADAEHWAGELLKGFEHPRPLAAADRAKLPPAWSGTLQWAFPVIPLTGFTALTTAFMNDVEPASIFAQLVWTLGQPGDVLAAISTSGNSENVCRAAQAAKARGMKVLALTGSNPCRLQSIADIRIAAPATQTRLIQEFHLPIYHCLSLMLETEWVTRLNFSTEDTEGNRTEHTEAGGGGKIF